MSYVPSWPEIRAATASDRGRQRHENQDACVLIPEQRLFILSDGMGGQNAGAVASRAVVSVLPRLVEQKLGNRQHLSDEEVLQKLKEAATELNIGLHEEAATSPALHGMGATVVLAMLYGCVAHIMHLGDSRAYLFRGRELRQLTQDHTLAAVLVRLQEITPEDARTLPELQRLSRYVGMEGAARPDVQTVQMKAGDRILLCSDGLTRMLSDDEIARLLELYADPQEACNALVAAANAAGGEDNISTIVIDIGAVCPEQRRVENSGL